MIKMKISVDNSQLEELQYYLRAAVEGDLPKTGAAMAIGAKKIQSVWQDYALGKKELPGVPALKKPSGKYAESIRTEPTGEFKHEIFSEAKIADWIENGTQEVDMKKTHPYGPRSRVSKKGVPYLIVPFQWGTEEGTKRVGPRNIVPKQLLGLMRSEQFKQSTVKDGTYLSPNARGQMVERWTYTWGSRARDSGFADGMVRFEQGKKGGKRYGGYFTFRIISAEKPRDWDKKPHRKPWGESWIKPATPAHHVTRGLQEYMEDEITMMVDEALKEDIKGLSKGVKNV